MTDFSTQKITLNGKHKQLVDLNKDKVWESFQAQTPCFLKAISIDQGAVQCSSNETFVEAGKRLGIVIGRHSGFHHLAAKVHRPDKIER